MTWLVAYTVSRGEFFAFSQIQAAGFEAYYPVFKRRVHRKGIKFVYSSLFPRYLFVKESLGWERIYRIKNIVGFLDNNGTIHREKDYVIEYIRERQQAGEFDEKPAQKYRPKWKRLRDALSEVKQRLDTQHAA